MRGNVHERHLSLSVQHSLPLLHTPEQLIWLIEQEAPKQRVPRARRPRSRAAAGLGVSGLRAAGSPAATVAGDRSRSKAGSGPGTQNEDERDDGQNSPLGVDAASFSGFPPAEN